jgi:hypothetical protein
VLSGPLPVRILRAAQFHEFVGQLVEWGRQDGVSRLQKMRMQLVAARTVAEALADLATTGTLRGAGSPHAKTLEIAGPRAESLVDATRRLVARRGDGIRVEEVANASDPDRALYENGALLPGPDALLGGPTFDAWLERAFR